MASESSKGEVNEEELNQLWQQVKKLQEDFDKARKMYEHCENEMKMKFPSASATEAEKKMKYITLQIEAQKQQMYQQQKKGRCLKF